MKSHRGYDPGALYLARGLSRLLQAELHASGTSRLLIALNRSKQANDLFSPYTNKLDPSAKREITAGFYTSFRTAVHRSITKLIGRRDFVTHLSIHTFTPRFRGQSRKFDIGVLYDPCRSTETRLADSLLLEFAQLGFSVRANEPYLGTDDGHTTDLRSRLPEEQYAGIELEVNNRFANFADQTKVKWTEKIASAITKTLR